MFPNCDCVPWPEKSGLAFALILPLLAFSLGEAALNA
jgi:hypothetical protein